MNGNKNSHRIQRMIERWAQTIIPEGVQPEMPLPTYIGDCTAFWLAAQYLYWYEAEEGAEITEGDMLVRFSHTYIRDVLVSNNITINPIKRNQDGRLFCPLEPSVVLPSTFEAGVIDRLFKFNTLGTFFPFILYKPHFITENQKTVTQ